MFKVSAIFESQWEKKVYENVIKTSTPLDLHKVAKSMFQTQSRKEYVSEQKDRKNSATKIKCEEL